MYLTDVWHYSVMDNISSIWCILQTCGFTVWWTTHNLHVSSIWCILQMCDINACTQQNVSTLHTHEGTQCPYKLHDKGCSHPHIFICTVFHRKIFCSFNKTWFPWFLTTNIMNNKKIEIIKWITILNHSHVNWQLTNNHRRVHRFVTLKLKPPDHCPHRPH